MHYTQNRLLNFSAQDLFDLVLDVTAYPTFIPGVHGASVQRLTDAQVMPGQLLGELEIGHGGLGGRYTSLVTFTPPNIGRPGEIIARSEAAFFKALEAHWVFEPLNGPMPQTQVIFTLDMTLQSRMLALMVQPLLPSMCAKVLQAFEAEAEMRYKK